MSTDMDIHDRYLNGSLLADIPENLTEFLSQEEDLSFDELILHQASLYQSYQDHGIHSAVVSDDDSNSESSSSSGDEGESSMPGAVISQELGEEFDGFSISELSGSANSTTESHAATPMEQDASPGLSQDNLDIENMRYEDLVDLSERVGVESTGLPAAHISQLPTSIYTSGVFSKNKEENCMVCLDNFKFGKRLTTLPCSHRYHRKCIGEWLKQKKNCPICIKDVV